MVESLQDVTKRGVESYPQHPRTQWVLEWPGQIVLVISAIYWTQDVTEVISSGVQGSLKECAGRDGAPSLGCSKVHLSEMSASIYASAVPVVPICSCESVQLLLSVRKGLCCELVMTVQSWLLQRW